MKQLETVYLANILLYLPTIESIIKFIFINKKCQDASKMIRFFNKRPLKENLSTFIDVGEKKKIAIIPMNLFDIFPKIQTIECCCFDLLKYSSIIQNVDRVKLTIKSDDYVSEINEKFKEKIVEIKDDYGYYGYDCLGYYPNLKKLNITAYGSDEYLRRILGDKTVSLDHLIIRSYGIKYFDFLKGCDNIKNKTVIFNRLYELNENTTKILEETNAFANVKIRYLIEGISFKYCYSSYDDVKIIEIPQWIEEIDNNYGLIDCKLKKACDLRKCQLLERIECLNEIKENKVQVGGLNKLTEIIGIHRMELDCIPVNLKKISFTDSFQFDQTAQWTENIKEIEFTQTKKTYDLSPFINCKKTIVSLTNGFDGTVQLPMKTEEIELNINIDDDEQIQELLKLENIKKMKLYFDKPIIPRTNIDKINKIAGIINHFKDIRELEINVFSNHLQIPFYLIKLKAVISENIDLSKYINLKEIELKACDYCDDLNVLIPINLDKMVIDQYINVPNREQAQVKSFIVI